MKTALSFILLLFLSHTSFSQFSVTAGTSILKGFATDKSYFGLNAGIEIPKSNDATFYARIGHYFSRTENQENYTSVVAEDFNTIPYQLTVNYRWKINYTTIEGGTRYYLGNDYDNGFSLYGGGNFMIYFNSIKRDYDKYSTSDIEWENDYELSSNEIDRGNFISLALGAQGGLKYTIPATGTFFFDINGQLTILGLRSNISLPNLNPSLFFTMNLGFRKDLY